MMIVTITSIKIRKLWHFFILSYLGLKVQLGIKSKAGFIEMKNTGFGYLHYTLTAWESAEDMKNFAPSGEHLEAMKRGEKIASQVRVYTFETEHVPAWKEAKKLVLEKGRIISFE
jgi:heme-degrading monooxygenase HmoA